MLTSTISAKISPIYNGSSCNFKTLLCFNFNLKHKKCWLNWTNDYIWCTAFKYYSDWNFTCRTSSPTLNMAACQYSLPIPFWLALLLPPSFAILRTLFSISWIPQCCTLNRAKYGALAALGFRKTYWKKYTFTLFWKKKAYTFMLNDNITLVSVWICVSNSPFYCKW